MDTSIQHSVPRETPAVPRELLDLMFYLFVLAFILTFFTGCASEPRVLSRGPLLEQRLQFRPGYHGLTNQTCVSYLKHKCTRMDVKEYDLRDVVTRNALREVKLICNVGGARYRVCKDKPGLCQQHEKLTKLFGLILIKRELIEVGYLDQEEKNQSILNLGTWCAAQESSLGQSMFISH